MLSNLEKNKKLKAFLKNGQIPYQNLIKGHSDAIYLIGFNGLYLQYNEGFSNLTGYDPEELIGKSFLTIIHKDDAQRMSDNFNNTITGNIKRREFRIVTKEGIIKTISTDAVPFHSDDGDILGIFVIGKDITKQKELESLIYQQDRKFRSLIKNSNDLISIINKNTDVVYRSPSIENVLGYKPEEISDELDALIHPDDVPGVNQILTDLFNKPGKSIKTEFRMEHKCGNWIHVQAVARNLLDDHYIRGVVVNYRDITDLKTAQREIQYMAYHDYLTNLPNIRYFEEKLELEIKYAQENNQKLAVMFIDLDRFKFVNDTLGHDVGDKVLIQVSKLLRDCLSDNKGVVARLAGDEFIIFVSNIKNQEIVKEIAEKIKQRFEIPFNIDHYELFVTASIGISIFPDSAEDLHTLKKYADLAMYLTKENGKNNYQFYTPKLDIKAFKSFSLQNDLQKALKQNQFELYYQPKVCATTNQIVGTEALIRWKHPEWGMVPPNEFICLAEDSGLIIPIGEWVLKDVCRQIKLWKEKGFEPIKVSINFSVLQLVQKDLVENLSKILKENSIEGKWLEIEITESVLSKNDTEMLSILEAIKNLGVSIALDDFGTGYSSLSYIRKYKFSTLKLDKSFVKDIHTNQESRAITKFIIDLAKQLKINVVAEGVECQEQLHLLRHLKCDELQGYLFSKPQSIKEFEKMLIHKTIDIRTTETERRESFRLKLDKLLESDMTIVELNGKNVELGKTSVLIEDIAHGGLHFSTDIKLPFDVPVILEFTTKILGKVFVFQGEPVWYKEDDPLHENSIKFIKINEEEEFSIVLDKIQNHSKKDSFAIDHTRFIQMNKKDYFKKNKQTKY